MRKFPALTFALLLPLAACESTAPEEAGITGTYSFQTINGSSLTHTVLGAGSDRFEVTAGTITLNSCSAHIRAMSSIPWADTPSSPVMMPL